MSAPSSKQSRLIKRYGKMAEGYQNKIERQSDAIQRLLAALEVAQFTLYAIANEDKSITAARGTAHKGRLAISEALALHNNQEEPTDG